MRIKEVSTARMEIALVTGWMSERFAREKVLRGPQDYISEMLNPDTSVEVQTAMAEAELARMALGWGLELEDIEPGEVA